MISEQAFTQQQINNKRSAIFFVSIYAFNKKEADRKLRVLEFKEPDEKWLDFVQKNRKGIRMDDYDIVSGPVADDNVYLSIKLFETGILNKEETIKRLKIRRLYNQILFHSEKSLEYCQYKTSLIPER